MVRDKCPILPFKYEVYLLTIKSLICQPWLKIYHGVGNKCNYWPATYKGRFYSEQVIAGHVNTLISCLNLVSSNNLISCVNVSTQGTSRRRACMCVSLCGGGWQEYTLCGRDCGTQKALLMLSAAHIQYLPSSLQRTKQEKQPETSYMSFVTLAKDNKLQPFIKQSHLVVISLHV